MSFVFCFLFLLSWVMNAKESALPTVSEANGHYVLNNEVLTLNGVAIHRRFIFNVYELTLYLKKTTQSAEEILSSSELKFARLRWLRDLEASEIRDGFRETFEENCLQQCFDLRPQLESFLEKIPDMPEGSVIEFGFLANKTVVRSVGYTEFEFPGRDFGLLFLRSWVGSSPPSNRFRNELLRGSVGVGSL